MSMDPIIVCRTCGSYQTERVPVFKLTLKPTWRYSCACCGDTFDVSDFSEYMKQHPPDTRRCFNCDKIGVELVEKNHRYPRQPDGEVVDLYRCAVCGQEILRLVKESPHVLSG